MVGKHRLIIIRNSPLRIRSPLSITLRRLHTRTALPVSEALLVCVKIWAQAVLLLRCPQIEEQF